MPDYPCFLCSISVSIRQRPILHTGLVGGYAALCSTSCMGSGLAGLVLLAGLFASLWSMRRLIDGNVGRIIPYSGRPQFVPRGVMPLRALGAGLTVAGGVQLGAELGIWSAAIVVVASLPPLVWQWRHNRGLEAEAPYGDPG